MRLSPARIKDLQSLLKEHYGLDYSDEEAQEAGLAIMRFVLAKELRQKALDENLYRNGSQSGRSQRSAKANQ